MKRTFIAAVVAVGALYAAGSASAATLLVDDNKAQCPAAQFTTITEALLFAHSGDTVRVCPGLYQEGIIFVRTPGVTLEATNKPDVNRCTTTDLTNPDPSRYAIVSGGDRSAFELTADDISLIGFIEQGNRANGIETDEPASGFRIRDNLAQRNGQAGPDGVGSGLALGSGDRLNPQTAHHTQVTHNCFRQNNDIGIAGNATVIDATIDHNITFANGFGSTFSPAGIDLDQSPGNFGEPPVRQLVDIDHNDTVREVSSILLGFATDSTVDHNNVTQSQGTGIALTGNDARVTVHHNRVDPGPSNGIETRGPQNANIEISHNDVSGRGADGLDIQANSLQNSDIEHNTFMRNLLDGLLIDQQNSGNTIAHNEANNNGHDGIRSTQSSGNLFLDNHMNGNADVDARDDNRPANTWTNNKCRTDAPPGTICKK